MVSITISAGAPAMNVEPGAYEVTLTAIDGPRTIFPQTGPNAGKEVEVLDWSFALDEGEVVTGTTSTASGPKSKLYAWLSALLGQAPAVGTTFEPAQLVGRTAIATIEMQDSGWPRIANLSALPKRASRPAAAPVKAAPADSDLPF